MSILKRKKYLFKYNLFYATVFLFFFFIIVSFIVILFLEEKKIIILNQKNITKNKIIDCQLNINSEFSFTEKDLKINFIQFNGNAITDSFCEELFNKNFENKNKFKNKNVNNRTTLVKKLVTKKISNKKKIEKKQKINQKEKTIEKNKNTLNKTVKNKGRKIDFDKLSKYNFLSDYFKKFEFLCKNDNENQTKSEKNENVLDKEVINKEIQELSLLDDYLTRLKKHINQFPGKKEKGVIIVKLKKQMIEEIIFVEDIHSYAFKSYLIGILKKIAIPEKLWNKEVKIII